MSRYECTSLLLLADVAMLLHSYELTLSLETSDSTTVISLSFKKKKIKSTVLHFVAINALFWFLI